MVFDLLILPTSFQGFSAFLRNILTKITFFIINPGFFAIFLSFLARGQLFFTKKQRQKTGGGLYLVRLFP